MVRMLSTTATANGVFQLVLGSVTGEVLVEAPSMTTITAINDTTAPAITVTLLGTIGGNITVTGTVNENIALSSFTAALNGVTQTFAVNPMSAFVARAAIPFSLTGLLPENGGNRLVIEGTDTSGNLSSVVKTCTYTMNTLLIAGSYRALLAPVGPASAANTGMVSVTLANNGSFTGKVDFMNASIPFSGLLRRAGTARFYVGHDLEETFDLVDQKDFDQFFGALAFSIDLNRTNGLQGSLTTQADNGSIIATFSAQLLLSRIPVDVLNQPSGGTFNKGVYAVVISSKLQSPSRAADSYPQGDGAASLTVTSTSVTLVGTLADGAAFTTTSDYRDDRSSPIFVPLYGAKGFLTGTLTYTSTTDSDVSGIDLKWFRPAQPAARYYPAGWPLGIKVDVVGTKFDGGSGDHRHTTLDFGQGSTSLPGGNARLSFTEGRLTAPINVFMRISPSTGASVLISANYTFDLVTSTGLFSGTNSHDGVTDIYRGALLNKGANRGGFGYFLSTPPNVVGGTGESGNISLVPLP